MTGKGPTDPSRPGPAGGPGDPRRTSPSVGEACGVVGPGPPRLGDGVGTTGPVSDPCGVLGWKSGVGTGVGLERKEETGKQGSGLVRELGSTPVWKGEQTTTSPTGPGVTLRTDSG